MLDENYIYIRRSQTKDCCVIQVTYKARINIKNEEAESDGGVGWLSKNIIENSRAFLFSQI